MSDTSITTPPGFAELPKAEQVRYLQALWDQISEHPHEIPVPESHLQLAEERLRRYRENPSSAPAAVETRGAAAEIFAVAGREDWRPLLQRRRRECDEAVVH